MTKMTKKEMEAEIARLQEELKNAKKAPANNKNNAYTPLTKKVAEGTSKIICKPSQTGTGNWNITSYTNPALTSWIKLNGYAFPSTTKSGKAVFTKGIHARHWEKAVKDMQKHGIEISVMSPLGTSTGI